MPSEPVNSRHGVDSKTGITNALYKTGVLRAFHELTRFYEITDDANGRTRLQRARQAKYLVLAYHRVGTKGPPLYSTLPQTAFAAQMKFIREHYRVLSVRQMREELQDPNAQGQAVVVTFDDGYADIFTEAFPVLQSYQIPATIYLIADASETGELPWYDKIFLRFQRADTNLTLQLDKPHTFCMRTTAARLEAAEKVVMYLRLLSDDERRQWCAGFEKLIPLSDNQVYGAMLNWNDVRTMTRAGIVFGAHTMTHPVVSRLLPNRLREEITDSKKLIEQRLNLAVDEFAFPFGKPRDCGMVAAEVLKQLGFLSAMTTIIGMNRPGGNLYRLRRVSVGNDTSIARFALQIQKLFFHPWDEEIACNVSLQPVTERL